MRFLGQIWKIPSTITVAITCFGCIIITPTEKAGQFIGRSLTENITAVYVGKDISLSMGEKSGKFVGDKNITIEFDEFPGLQMWARLSSDGSFVWTELYFLRGSPFGWNEFTQELTGNGGVKFTESFASVTAAAPERGQITSAKILHNGDKLQGAEALSSLYSRSERIYKLAEWMHTELKDAAVHFPNEEVFAAYWKPILLPEMVSAKKRPSTWTSTDDWAIAEDIKWNISYTKRIFVDDLRALRDSGALLRDWEEALPWLYFAYEWNYIQGLFSAGEMTLVRE
ncbi:MAG: hypothetical protein LBG05_03705 [Treponema sp.]|jgi:hypothetical protein|nr:hypothetical protein [Treponema sp.]